MESEAVEAYYLDRKGFEAERPGVIITDGMFLSPDAKKGEHFTVWFGQGIGHWNFKTLKDAQAKVAEILSKSREPITPRIVKR
jgi:hypothetical protein